MKSNAIACRYCGSASLRRSRRQAWYEALRMMAGSYPFRCLDCNERSWASVWLVSRLRYAKCPKCLGLELTPWSRRHYRLSFWQNLVSTFGAHKYRCAKCRYYFLSFRRPYAPLVEGEESTVVSSPAPPQAEPVPESAAER
jgi:DNA-directed RNA polymerase subunit RPC12/RpoP